MCAWMLQLLVGGEGKGLWVRVGECELLFAPEGNI